MVPGRVVVLGLEADDSCEEKCKSCGERAVKLRLEWNDNFGMSWSFRVLDDFGLDGTWTCRIQFGYFCQLSRALHEFSFCCMTCLWVSCAQKPRWSVLQFCDGLCMHWQLDLDWVCGLSQVCIIFVFCLRHWSLVDHILPVKMCGTHLGVVLSVIFVGSVSHLLRCASRTLGWTRESLCLAWHEMAEP